MPAGAEYFTLEVNGTRVHQVLSDRAHAPSSHTPPVQTSAPLAPSPPPAIADALPVSNTKPEEEDDPDAEWRSINFELAKKDEETDIDLEKPKDE